jgi:peptide chain release factor 2
VTVADHSEALTALDSTLRNIEAVLDLDRMRKEKSVLEEQASVPDLWDDPAKAQQVTSRLSYVQGEINRVEKLRARLDDARVLLELGEAEDDAASVEEVGTEISALRKQIDELEVRTSCPASTTHGRPWCRCAPAPAASTRPTSPRC